MEYSLNNCVALYNVKITHLQQNLSFDIVVELWATLYLGSFADVFWLSSLYRFKGLVVAVRRAKPH